VEDEMETTVAKILKGEIKGYFLPLHSECEEGILIYSEGLRGINKMALIAAAKGNLRHPTSCSRMRVLLESGKEQVRVYSGWEAAQSDANIWGSFKKECYLVASTRVAGGAGLTYWKGGRPQGSGGSTFVLSTYQRRDGSLRTKVLY
jgi:hypothetical protein